MATPPVLPASNMIGSRVTNIAGEDLGKIEDITIDVEHGLVAYAVLSFGGILGLGSKFFAVPWKLLRLRDDERFELDVTKEHLEKAPGFDKDDWPDFGDREWGRAMHRHWNVETYWG